MLCNGSSASAPAGCSSSAIFYAVILPLSWGQTRSAAPDAMPVVPAAQDTIAPNTVTLSCCSATPKPDLGPHPNPNLDP